MYSRSSTIQCHSDRSSKHHLKWRQSRLPQYGIQYLDDTQHAQLRQAEQDAGISILDFIRGESEELFLDLSGAGDIVSCIRDGNVIACLWSLVGLLGAARIGRATYKLAAMIPKLVNLIKTIKDGQKTRDGLREIARQRKKLKDRDRECEGPNSFCPAPRCCLPTVATARSKM